MAALNGINIDHSSNLNFSIDDIIFQNCYYENKKNLIRFSSMETDQDFTFYLNNWKFSNITFLKKGNMILMQQQLLNRLVLQNSLFENIESGTIYIESANKQNTVLKTNVLMSNITFRNINDNDVSLIEIAEGGQLEITDSSFTAVSCFEEGGILFAGFQRTQTIIRNSNFTENASVQGGVIFGKRSFVTFYSRERKCRQNL